jgi:RNA recognition motif-containing protein
MGKKLYCGNLSYDVRSEQLEELFSEFGSVVSAQVIEDRDTGRSKGFGFVEMSNQQEANAAITGLNGKDHGGRNLQVNEAKPREDRPRTGGGGGGGGGGRSGGGGGGGGNRGRW